MGQTVSGGFAIGYGEIHQSLQNVEGTDTTTVDNTISSVPVYFGGKYWFGAGENRFQAFLGVAFGMYFSQLETSVKSGVGFQNQEVGGSYTSETAIGFGMGVPVGIVLSLGDSFMLTANYTLNWLWANEFLDNNILNAVSLGVALRFDG